MENQRLTAQSCRGNWGTLLLPINEDDSIDFQRLSDEIDLLIAAGVDGIYSNGTAGEFHLQRESEFDRISQLLAEKCHARGTPFQIGASHPVPAITLERIQRSKHLDPAAYQVIPPDWVAVNLEEGTNFLKRAAAVAYPIPIVLYNPPHAKKVFQPEDYAALAVEIPTLISIKLMDGDADWYKRMKEVASAVAVFVPGHHLATGVQNGIASGAYSNVACINPRAAQHWWETMQTSIEEAVAVEQQIQAFFSSCIVPFAKRGFSNPALDKLLAAVGNWADIGTRLRWPYRSIPANEVAAVRREARTMLPDWFFKVHQ